MDVLIRNKMFKKSIPVFAVAAALGLITACDESRDVNGVTPNEIKANYVQMAHAVYNDSLTTATALQQAVTLFIATPTEANLLAARAAYKEARIPYQQSEIMRFDSAITVDKNLSADGGLSSVDDWEGQVNAWPLDENHIDSIINGNDEINIDLLLAQNNAGENEANVTTGVHAIEYMLWGADNNGVNAGAGERPASDYDVANCADTLCERRAQYLSAAANLLVNDLTAMVAEWTPAAAVTPGTLSYNFMDSELALDYIIGSIHAMATDELAGARMNSGLFTGDTEEEHDCFSDLSHVAIYYNFQGVKNAFYGEYQNVKGSSIGDLINSIDPNTYNTIDQALQSIDGHMSAVLSFGERTENTVRFDQIIGQSSSAPERMIAEQAVSELFALDAELRIAANVLSLSDIDVEGSGD